ncbi:hypothetical protein F5H01DRAFT_371574 [Linnemannia elongata]|nr:hypothetical protein F5H01DRAFT_371574 [Linnemannia elongata]
MLNKPHMNLRSGKALADAAPVLPQSRSRQRSQTSTVDDEEVELPIDAASRIVNFLERDWNDALSTISAPKIEGYGKTFHNKIIGYPTKGTDKMPAPSELPKDPRDVQQVVIDVGDNNSASPRNMWSK